MNPMRIFLAILALLAWPALTPASASAAEAVFEHTALQRAVATQIFSENGRKVLLRGACFAYLDNPKVSVANGRLFIKAHLAAKLGYESGGSCMGVPLASDVTVSGTVTASGSTLGLTDLRLEGVSDPTVQQLLSGELLPVYKRALTLDLQDSIQKALADPRLDRITVAFEFKIEAH
jgi:hypothetical protein